MRIRNCAPGCLVLLLMVVALPMKAQAPYSPILNSSSLNSAMGSSAQSQTPGSVSPAAVPPTTHRFWDRENDWLFAAVVAGRGLDYASTLNIRRRGINEAFLTNSIVDNHPLFAGIEAAATAASIGLSYVFHRTGHHELERWTSIVHFGVAVGGAARNYALKTPHAD